MLARAGAGEGWPAAWRSTSPTKHRDIIRKFGRFPHRNAMLGRESTPEELSS